MSRRLMTIIVDGALVPFVVFAAARTAALLVIHVWPASNGSLVSFLSDVGIPGYQFRPRLDLTLLPVAGILVTVYLRALSTLLGVLAACIAGIALVFYPVAVFAGDLPGFGPVRDTLVLTLLLTVPTWLAIHGPSKAMRDPDPTI